MTTVFNVFLNKKVMEKLTVQKQAIYRISFSLPFILISALSNWRFTNELIPYILVFGVLAVSSILIYYWAIKVLDGTTIILLARSNMIVSLFLSAVVGLESITTTQVVGTIIFIASILMVSDISKSNMTGISNKEQLMAITIRLIDIAISTYQAYIIKDLIDKGLGTNETIQILTSVVQLSLLIILFRPKLNLKEIRLDIYITQGIFSGISTALTGYAYMTIGVMAFNSVKTSSVIFVALIYAFIDRKAPSLRKISGIVLGIISLWIIMYTR